MLRLYSKVIKPREEDTDIGNDFRIHIHIHMHGYSRKQTFTYTCKHFSMCIRAPLLRFTFAFIFRSQSLCHGGRGSDSDMCCTVLCDVKFKGKSIGYGFKQAQFLR